MEYRRKQRVVAVQWNTHGDHPAVERIVEGKNVYRDERALRALRFDFVYCFDDDEIAQAKETHGYLPRQHGAASDSIVRPGDFIVADAERIWCMERERFEEFYEPVEESDR